MKNLLLILLLSLTTVASQAPVYITDSVGPRARYFLKVNVSSPQEMAKYTHRIQQSGFDVAGSNWRQGIIEIVTDEFGVSKLAQLGLPGFQRSTPQNIQAALDSRFLNPDKVEQALKALNQKFPQFSKLEQIGTSNNGRPIWALLISTTPNMRSADYYTKPTILFDALHHAREVMTPEVVLDVGLAALNTLARGQRQAAELAARWNIWIVPMLNVDGSDIVWRRDSMWRKNARAQGNRVFGVDINRNYGFGWNRCSGSSGSPNAQDYRGPEAASEPETKALMNLAQQIRPAAYLSYHSFSELVLYPYGCRGVLTGENALIAKVANEVAQILPSDSGRGTYTPGTPWQLLYSTDGDSMGYMFGEFGAVSFTFEINQSFQPSFDLRGPTVEKHRRAWAYLLNRFDNNMLTLRIVDGRTQELTKAQVGISNIPFLQGEKPFRTNARGHFFKVLDPGDYTLFAQLADGRRGEIKVRMTGQAQTVDLVIP
jgi:carboxypeptidase T